jgi:hypothetical protein
MRRTIDIIILVFFLFNCTYTATHYIAYEREDLIVISERVGETIDADEREQFDLFNKTCKTTCSKYGSQGC